jgi:hypothetical protein
MQECSKYDAGEQQGCSWMPKHQECRTDAGVQDFRCRSAALVVREGVVDSTTLQACTCVHVCACLQVILCKCV